jgi:ArsR family transcriptional regulator, virulence genes transcriptional regulator
MQIDLEKMQKKSKEVSEFMKCFGSPHRLLILCQLADGEKNVTQLIEATGIAQTSMSQHLAKLKSESIVDFRRDHRTLYYRISNPDAIRIMSALYDIFCGDSV